MKPYRNILSGVIMMATLAACGTTKGERALSGGAIGAGVGAVGGALAGGNPTTGAIIGGAAGAAIGAVTDKNDINFGDIK
jgi:osmotically inducible lipoprotein OsmB